MLIFCSSRKGCESTAKHVAKYLKSFSVNINGENEYPDITSAINALQKSPAGLDPVLGETLPSGVAYHHAGLTVCILSCPNNNHTPTPSFHLAIVTLMFF